jgi:hypothetical protein
VLAINTGLSFNTSTMKGKMMDTVTLEISFRVLVLLIALWDVLNLLKLP